MDVEHEFPAAPEAAPLSAPPAWRSPRVRRIAIVAAGAVVVGLGAAGLADAASSPSPSPSKPGTAPGAPDGPGRAYGHGFGRFGKHGRFGPGGPPGLDGRFGLGGPMDALHGEVVTAKRGGGYQTVDFQRGVATAVSAASITVKSADGFTKTYTVPADAVVDAGRDGIGSIKKGDTVSVDAVVTGHDAAVRSIDDESLLKAAFQKWMPPAPPGAPGPSGANSSTNEGGAYEGAYQGAYEGA